MLIIRLSGREFSAYRLFYNLLSLVMFGWVMAAYRNSPVLYYVPGAWSLLMYMLQLVLAFALFSCVRQTGAADFIGLSQVRPGEASQRHLVTGGYYSFVRHPLYLFTILFLILNPVMTARWGLMTIMSVIYFVCGALIEEQRLLEDFGERYRRYRREVPFMVPSPRSLKSRLDA